MGTAVATTPMVADNIKLFAGLLDSDGGIPSKFTITLNNTVDVAATDTSVTVQALGGEVRAGTYLTFVEPTSGALKTVYVTANAAAGATSLSIGDGNSTAYNGVADAGSPVGIENLATAQYPPELFDATDSSEQNSPNTVSGQTYNSNGYAVVVNTGNAFSLNVPLFFYQYNNGAARTLKRAADNLQNVAIIKEYPADLGYTAGEIFKSKCSVSYSNPSVAGDVIKTEFTFNVLGAPTRVNPV